MGSGFHPSGFAATALRRTLPLLLVLVAIAGHSESNQERSLSIGIGPHSYAEFYITRRDDGRYDLSKMQESGFAWYVSVIVDLGKAFEYTLTYHQALHTLTIVDPPDLQAKPFNSTSYSGIDHFLLSGVRADILSSGVFCELGTGPFLGHGEDNYGNVSRGDGGLVIAGRIGAYIDLPWNEGVQLEPIISVFTGLTNPVTTVYYYSFTLGVVL